MSLKSGMWHTSRNDAWALSQCQEDTHTGKWTREVASPYLLAVLELELAQARAILGDDSQGVICDTERLAVAL